MSVFKTFSKRKKEQQLIGHTDIYQYEMLPKPFRIQIIHVWNSAIGPYVSVRSFDTPPASNSYWDKIHNIMAREMGVFHLGTQSDDPFDQCQIFLLTCNAEHALDIIELTFQFIYRVISPLSEGERRATNITQSPEDAIDELNERFREHWIGYQFENGEIVRVDSQLLHAEVVKPVLSLLQTRGFEGPADEFMCAHEHYRHGRNKEALAEALKSLESTLKAICSARNWIHPSNATAKPLLDIVFKKGLVPSELSGHIGSLRAALESGLPTLSNRNSRHGQGVAPIIVPGYIAAYALHLAATNIVFLIEAHLQTPISNN